MPINILRLSFVVSVYRQSMFLFNKISDEVAGLKRGLKFPLDFLVAIGIYYWYFENFGILATVGIFEFF